MQKSQNFIYFNFQYDIGGGLCGVKPIYLVVYLISKYYRIVIVAENTLRVAVIFVIIVILILQNSYSLMCLYFIYYIL